jgi:hypothetical protein
MVRTNGVEDYKRKHARLLSVLLKLLTLEKIVYQSGDPLQIRVSDNYGEL